LIGGGGIQVTAAAAHFSGPESQACQVPKGRKKDPSQGKSSPKRPESQWRRITLRGNGGEGRIGRGEKRLKKASGRPKKTKRHKIKCRAPYTLKENDPRLKEEKGSRKKKKGQSSKVHPASFAGRKGISRK